MEVHPKSELIKEMADYILMQQDAKNTFIAGLILGSCFHPDAVMDILDEVHTMEESDA